MRRVLVSLLTCLVIGCGAERTGAADVAPQEALALEQEGVLFLDVRTPEEYASGHVPGAVNIPYDEVSARVSELESRRDDAVVVYCEKGPRASKARAVLEGAGFTAVRSLAGHMAAWRTSGLPVAR